MPIVILVKYLLGRRAAIEGVATHPHALKIGLLFVLAAGFAREYDQEYLLREPWHALLPLAVSTTLALILGTLFWMMRPLQGHSRPSIFAVYRMFIALLWMMAPMAWLYAVPYEHFMSAGAATQMNLWTLAFVAAWRVLLLSRVISVTLGIHGVRAFMTVMLLADAAVLTTLSIVPLPLFGIMGGMRLSAAEEVIAEASFLVTTLGALSLPVWLVGAIFGLSARTDWRLLGERGSIDEPLHMRGRLGWLAVACLALGVSLLPRTQREQGRRWMVESSMRDGGISPALAFMSAHHPDDFPPHWDPPPRLGYRERDPDLANIAQVIHANNSAEWVRALYATKLETDLRNGMQMGWRSWTAMASNIINGQGRPAKEWARRIPQMQALLDIGRDLTADDREAIQRIIDWSQMSSDEGDDLNARKSDRP